MATAVMQGDIRCWVVVLSFVASVDSMLCPSSGFRNRGKGVNVCQKRPSVSEGAREGKERTANSQSSRLLFTGDKKAELWSPRLSALMMSA